MSSTLSKNYEPGSSEDKWYEYWLKKGYFTSRPDGREPFTVVIPPPNVTGVLHMGHTLNETVQDILVRKARMSGFNACWVPGSDHASIATEAKVVQMLQERGISKHELSREEFLKYAFEWKEKYGGIIYYQLKKLGCSVDWDRVTFTMDDHYYKAVIQVFVDLFNKGMIYRGARMINWDPAALTALSDEEVEYRDVPGTLYYVKYEVVDAPADVDPYITIATQRPETIMGDTAICVHPDDPRYAQLHGRRIRVPLTDRDVPVILDTYVDPEFGTGALKVTPAHDINDYNLGLKHGLPTIDTLTQDGKISEEAGVFVGLDRFEARKKIVAELAANGQLVKEEQYQTRLGYSQRSHAVVEPRISTQWFVKMRDLANQALDAVNSGEVEIHPGERFLATYRYWLENVKDWCISRQLWWGQRIPAWYDDQQRFVVAATEAEARRAYHLSFGVEAGELTQDEDVLDTWFSSWLWPMEVFNGISNPDNEDIKYYYPTNVLVTGQDIIFFWVARMIMAGGEYMHEKPFSHVYFTGMVRDKQGRKMSKSLGNSPDLLELIERFGADAVRFGIMIAAPAGNDLLFDDSSCEQGRLFNNKLWNALKLVKMLGERVGESTNEEHFAARWFESRLNAASAQVEQLYSQFKLSEALKLIYSLIWDDFCSWYLEWIKPGADQPMDASLYASTLDFFSRLMQMLHPFMPFITEEIQHELKDGAEDLCVMQFAEPGGVDSAVIEQGDTLKQLISAARDARQKQALGFKDAVKLYIQGPLSFEPVESLLKKQINASLVERTQEPVANAINALVGTDKIYFVFDKEIDTESQREELLKDLFYYQGFLASVEKKLGNERFVSNAKAEVVDAERKKKADAEMKIRSIEEALAGL